MKGLDKNRNPLVWVAVVLAFAALSVQMAPAAPPDTYFFDYVTSEPLWTFQSTVVFDVPQYQAITNAPGYLTLKAKRNQDSFGYWESPLLDLTAQDSVYVAESFILTSVPTPSRVPQLRLRSTAENLQQTVMINSDSRNDGLFSPTSTGRPYDLVFSPAPGGDRAWFEFEIINMDPGDDPQGDFKSDWFRLTRHSVSELTTRTLVRTYDFENDTEGWTAVESVPPFESPIASRENGALVLKGSGGYYTFGYWTSNATDIPIDPSLMYIITFRVGSDIPAESRQRSPQFRARVNESTFHATSALSVESRGTAERSPAAGQSQDYTFYFRPPEAIQGNALILSFDFCNFDPDDIADGSLWLESATVETAPYPW